MTKQSPDGRYQVYSSEAYRDYPNVSPAGRYDLLRDAIKHAESVTYRMGVVDSRNESAGFVYCNWELSPTSSPWAYPDEDEEQEVCPQCGHSETSDGYGGNDCPDCWGERGEKVAMQVCKRENLPACVQED